jgi:hypothetical protein
LVAGTDPSNTNSVVLNIPTNSSAVIDSTSMDYTSIVSLTIQGVPLSRNNSVEKRLDANRALILSSQREKPRR